MAGRAAGPAGPGLSDRARMMQLLSGPWLAQSCYALTKLGIPDLLEDGPRAVAGLAADSGAHPRALRRMLRALAVAGIFAEPSPGVFALTPLSQLLTSGATRSSRSSAIMFGEEVFRSFAEIEYTLRTGNPAFEKVYGQPFYDYLGGHPEAAQTFNAAMGRAPVPQALATCDLAGARTVVDIGGGNGGLLASVLRSYPGARGILLDLPEAVRQARGTLSAAGLADRVDFVEGSFFDAVPAGADAYVLARVLHNWDDANAVALLCRVRAAMAPGSRLFVFEQLLEPAGAQGEAAAAGGGHAGNEHVSSVAGPQELADGAGAGGAGGSNAGDVPAGDRGTAETGTAAVGGTRAGIGAGGGPVGLAQVMDLLILLMLPGCDRTEAEYRGLLAAAGLGTVAVRPPPLRAPGAESVLEAVPAPRLP